MGLKKIKELINMSNFLSKIPFKKILFFLFVTIFLALLISAFLSSMLASFLPVFDKNIPSVVNIFPNANNIIYNDLSNVTIDVKDNGMGIDENKSLIKLSSKKYGEIEGVLNFQEDKFIFIPSQSLLPDIYTINIFLEDKASNFMAVPFSSVFYLSKEPDFNFWTQLSGHTYFSGDKVGDIVWKDSNRYYSFLIENKESSAYSLEEVTITLNFPVPIVGFRTSHIQNSQTCELRYPEGRELIADKNIITIPSCDLILECAKLPPSGAYSGQIFIDLDYSGPGWFCNNLSNYEGSYFWEEFDYIKKKNIRGKII